jgi:hypothetical protein
MGGGGSPEKRTYDVSRGQNRYVRLPLFCHQNGNRVTVLEFIELREIYSTERAH